MTQEQRAGGSDNPFPLDAQFELKSAGSSQPAMHKRLGRGQYKVHQIGPTVTIYATGEAPNLQTVVKLEQLPLTIFPPRFGLFFYDPPITLPATKPFSVESSFHSEQRLEKVTILDADGLHPTDVENF